MINSKTSNHTTPHHTTPHHTTPHHTTPHHTTPHHTTPHHTTPQQTTPHHTTPHHTTPHHITPHHTTPQHNTPHPIKSHHITKEPILIFHCLSPVKFTETDFFYIFNCPSVIILIRKPHLLKSGVFPPCPRPARTIGMTYRIWRACEVVLPQSSLAFFESG